jgi:hypothetical protein
MRMNTLDDARWRKPIAAKPAASRQEAPLTPAMIASLRAQGAEQRTGIGAGVTVALLAAACLALSLLHLISWDPIMILVCGALGVPLAIQLLRADDGLLRDDAEAGVYVRVSGPLTLRMVAYEESGIDYCVSVDDEEFWVSRWTFERLRGSAWGVMEYLPRSHYLLALRDAAGTLITADRRYVTT